MGMVIRVHCGPVRLAPLDYNLKTTLSFKATLAFIYIILFPMNFCQWAYFKTVGLLPASIAALGMVLLVPAWQRSRCVRGS